MVDFGLSSTDRQAPIARAGPVTNPRMRTLNIEPALHAERQTYGGQPCAAPSFLTVAGIGLLSVGTCLGFATAALFATGAEPIKFAKPQMAVSISDDTAGGRSACAPPRRRSLSGAAKGGRIRGQR
jgi:hypothetical protein